MDMVLARIISPISEGPMDMKIWKKIKSCPIVTGFFARVTFVEDGEESDAFIVPAETIVKMFKRDELEEVFMLPLEKIDQIKLYSFPLRCVMPLTERGEPIAWFLIKARQVSRFFIVFLIR